MCFSEIHCVCSCEKKEEHQYILSLSLKLVKVDIYGFPRLLLLCLEIFRISNPISRETEFITFLRNLFSSRMSYRPIKMSAFISDDVIFILGCDAL
jgi:hypothetical protein